MESKGWSLKGGLSESTVLRFQIITSTSSSMTFIQSKKNRTITKVALSALTLLSFALPCLGENSETTAIASIQSLGGTVRGIAQNSDALEVDFHLDGVGLNDEGLIHIKKLKNIATLHLGGTKVTSAGIVHLSNLKQLQRLHLEKTEVDDDGIAELGSLLELEYLNLYATKITDAGLKHLVGLKNLRRLYLWQTKVTDEGVTKLQKFLPDLVIDTGADLSTVTSSGPPAKKVDLKWIPSGTAEPPRSRNGPNTAIHFANKSGKKVKLFWVKYTGGLQLYGELPIEGTRRQNTYSGNTWVITDEKDNRLGYFISVKEEGLAIIPHVK
jgi:hypothetical protein